MTMSQTVEEKIYSITAHPCVCTLLFTRDDSGGEDEKKR